MTQPAKVPATYPLTCCDAFSAPSGERVTGRDLGPHHGDLDEQDLAQRVLGVVGDADSDGVAVDGNPLVATRIAQILGNHHDKT